MTEKSILKQIGFFPDPSVAKYKISWIKDYARIIIIRRWFDTSYGSPKGRFDVIVLR